MTSALAFVLGLSLAAPLWAASFPLLECERARYYEGEEVSCVVRMDLLRNPLARQMTVAWNVFSKNLKRETQLLPITYKVLPSVRYGAPESLRAVTPLTVRVQFTEPLHAELSEIAEQDVLIFPRNPKYWVGPEEFKNKKILVEKDVEWVCAELEALGIPYERATGRDLQAQKRFDLTLTETLLKSLDRKDPWSRWELVQLLRKALEEK